MSLEEIDEFLANMNGETDAMYDEYFPQEAAGSMDFLLKQAQVGPEYAEKMKQILSANTEITDTAIIQKASDYGSSNGVLFLISQYSPVTGWALTILISLSVQGLVL